MELLTVGHGTLAEDRFGELLSGAGVELLVDVRRAPGSRRHPHFSRPQMEIWVPNRGIGYEWEPALGGWRKAEPDSPNTALRNASFRGYADYALTAEFAAGLGELRELAGAARTAMLCSEGLWWRCHRRIVADRLVTAGDRVCHIAPDGRATPHEMTPFGVPQADGTLVYPG